MKEDEIDRLDHNHDLFKSLAGRSLSELGETPPDTPPEGKTWRAIWEDADSRLAKIWFDTNFCHRCKLNPIEPKLGETICIICTYDEKGEDMFTPDVIRTDGLILRKDHFGRVHVLPETLPDHFDWPVLKTVKAALHWFGNKDEMSEHEEK